MSKIIIRTQRGRFSLSNPGYNLALSLDGKSQGSLFWNPQREIEVQPGTHSLKVTPFMNLRGNSKSVTVEVADGETKRFLVEGNPRKNAIILSLVIVAFIAVLILKHNGLMAGEENGWVRMLCILGPFFLATTLLYRSSTISIA